MDTEQGEPEEVLSAPSSPIRGRTLWPARIGVGAVVSFVALSLLYGANQAVMIVGLLVICTAGLGLIPILFLSWMVGWIVIAAWEAIFTGRGSATVS